MVALVRIVEHLIIKKKTNGNGGAAAALSSQQSEELHQLYVLHNRFDNNGVPKWYFPHNMQDVIVDHANECKTDCKSRADRIKDDTSVIKDNQQTMNNRINDLITSQNRLVDRMGDLIGKLDRVVITNKQ